AHGRAPPLPSPSIGSETRLAPTFTFPAFALAARAEVIAWNIPRTELHRAVLNEQSEGRRRDNISSAVYVRTGRSSAPRSQDARSAAREYVLSTKSSSAVSGSLAAWTTRYGRMNSPSSE